MKNIARALDVEIKNLFEFAHLQAGGVKVEEIEKLLEGAEGEKTDDYEDCAGGGAVKTTSVTITINFLDDRPLVE